MRTSGRPIELSDDDTPAVRNVFYSSQKMKNKLKQRAKELKINPSELCRIVIGRELSSTLDIEIIKKKLDEVQSDATYLKNEYERLLAEEANKDEKEKAANEDHIAAIHNAQIHLTAALHRCSVKGNIVNIQEYYI